MAPAFVPPNVVKVKGVWQIEGKPREDFNILAQYHPSNLPGKTILVGSVIMPPNSATPPHRHGGAAIVAIGFQGSTLNQMNGDEPIICGPGEFWYEAPGCHHQRGENVSQDGETAKFIAVLIVDDETIKDDPGAIFVLDKEVEMGEKKGEIEVAGGTACH